MNTLVAAHQRLDKLDPKVEQIDRDVASLKTEVKIQFREVFTRVKRIEAILIGTAGTIISMLAAILLKMT
jgi:tetrahydromethanopterin S-methyltransferase subunit F